MGRDPEAVARSGEARLKNPFRFVNLVYGRPVSDRKSFCQCRLLGSNRTFGNNFRNFYKNLQNLVFVTWINLENATATLWCLDFLRVWYLKLLGLPWFWNPTTLCSHSRPISKHSVFLQKYKKLQKTTSSITKS